MKLKISVYPIELSSMSGNVLLEYMQYQVASLSQNASKIGGFLVQREPINVVRFRIFS